MLPLPAKAYRYLTQTAGVRSGRTIVEGKSGVRSSFLVIRGQTGQQVAQVGEWVFVVASRRSSDAPEKKGLGCSLATARRAWRAAHDKLVQLP